MKHLKTYEFITNPEKLKIGNYVILNITEKDIKDYVRSYINDNIGLVYIASWGEENVEYYNIPDNVYNWVLNHNDAWDLSVDDNETLHVDRVQQYEVLYMSDNEEELKTILQANKYNL